MILVGTSGFSYEDWRGNFYPESLPKTEFLSFYSQHFNACEINYTYYAMPAARTMESLVRKSAGAVTFVVKAHRSMTHEGTADDAALAGFDAALEPLRAAGVLGGLLLQFPWSFRPKAQSRQHVERLAQRLKGNDLIVELRNAEWIEPPTFQWLRDLGLGFCCVDEPKLKGLVPPTAEATSNVGYVRFHGRNARKWWKHERPEERYDYLYKKAQLSEWVPKIKKLESKTDRTLVFTNNHYEAKAVQNAKM
ncbi:MAG: DUF72 domain-containing protein, partial [Candidatus Alcyoniella australis]|nr:DUF72 domain-containing protein [Candidatus Alcyoniella australis]